MEFNFDNINLNKKVIQSIQNIGQNYAIRQIVLFGSRARGDHKITSDVDLAVFPLTEFANRGRLTSDFDDIETLLKIDIVFVDGLDPKLMENIRKEGVLLYERTMDQS